MFFYYKGVRCSIHGVWRTCNVLTKSVSCQHFYKDLLEKCWRSETYRRIRWVPTGQSLENILYSCWRKIENKLEKSYKICRTSFSGNLSLNGFKKENLLLYLMLNISLIRHKLNKSVTKIKNFHDIVYRKIVRWKRGVFICTKRGGSFFNLLTRVE